MSWRWFPYGVGAGLGGWLAMVWDAWWAIYPLGLAVGLLLGRRTALAAGLLAGTVAWGLPLLAAALMGLPVGRAAAVLSSILGVEAGGVPALALTLLSGGLLGLTGAWLGSSLRALGRRARAVPSARVIRPEVSKAA